MKWEWDKFSKDEEFEKIEEVDSFNSCAWMIRKDYFEELGGHLEELGEWGGENVEWTIKAKESNGKIIIRTDVINAHLFRTDYPYKIKGLEYNSLTNILKKKFKLDDKIEKVKQVLSFNSMVEKYVESNNILLPNDNVIHEINGAVLCRTGDALFDFHEIVVDEVVKYCKENGYEVDKVVFVSSYDVPINDKVVSNLKMKADSKISIIKENEKIIARVFIGESVKINEK